MSKYIDADCLRTEIKNLIEKYSSIKAKGVLQEGYKGGRLIGYEDILYKLDSLQQEQRDTDGDDGKFVKILVRKEFAEQLQKLGDEIKAVQSSFIGAMNQQELPEIDLEDYISNKLRELGADLINHKPYSFNRGLNVGKTNAYHDIFDKINARKEENK